MEIHQCLSLVGSQHSSDGKERCSIKNFNVTNANSSPNLLSRDACFRIEVLQTCFMVTGKEIHLPQPEPVINKTTSVSNIEEMSQSTNHIAK